MKFLFSVQGEGRGHFTQALSMAAMLRKDGHEVIAVLVGKNESREVPHFFSSKINAPVFTFNSPNFTSFYKKKKPNILISVIDNFFRPYIFRKSIQFVKSKIEEYKPDVVINFYELITGMTYGLYKLDKKLNIPVVCVGHQYVLLNPNFKTSKEQDLKFYFLRTLTKWTCQRSSKILALSFRDMPDCVERNIVTVPPLLRPEVFQHTSKPGDYIHGYMLNTGFFEEIQKWHVKNPDVPLRFFWDKKDADEVTKIDDNFIIHTLNDELFLESMASSRAYATTSGFESLCEAMYYEKPILMIPVHIEQEFNAYDAGLSGAGVKSGKFKMNKLLKFIPDYKPDEKFRPWIESAEELFVKEICRKPLNNKALDYKILFKAK